MAAFLLYCLPNGPRGQRVGGAFGDFLNTVIIFVIIALIFFVVKPDDHLMSLRKTEVPVAPATSECPYCLSGISDKASRCAFCTAEVAPA